MSKIDINDLLKVINVLSPSEEQEQEQENNKDPKGGDPKPKTEEEIRAEILAELEAAKKSEEEDPKEDPKEEDPKEDREAKHIDRAIKTGLKDADVDDSVAKQLSSFVNYATLKNEEGEADDEKINSFVELVSSVARRVPPKGAPKSGASDDGGFGKYLQDK